MSNARTLASLIDGSNIVVPSGYGLDFSANANASGMTSEVLDDYEEGFNSGVISVGGTAQSASYLYYTKIGRLVSVTYRMDVNPASNSGAVTLDLPFVIVNEGNYNTNPRLSSIASIYNTSLVYRYDYVFYANFNSSTMSLQTSPNSAYSHPSNTRLILGGTFTYNPG